MKPTSCRPTKTAPDQPYTYQTQAMDPENQPLAYALVQYPAGMSVSKVGLVFRVANVTLPKIPSAGKRAGVGPVTVPAAAKVLGAFGAAAIQSWNITVALGKP